MKRSSNSNTAISTKRTQNNKQDIKKPPKDNANDVTDTDINLTGMNVNEADELLNDNISSNQMHLLTEDDPQNFRANIELVSQESK